MNDAFRQAIEQVKLRLPIEEVVRQHVPGLKRQGALWVACCPFHEERTPSFKVDPRRGTWHCYGACGTGGDQLSFVQRVSNVEFVEALEILAAQAGVELPRRGGRGADPEANGPLYDALERAARFYAQALRAPEGAAARAYLRARGLEDETVRAFGVGYAPVRRRPGVPSDLLVSRALKAGVALQALTAAGLAQQGERGDVYDFFRDKLMFPVRDLKGRTVGFGARRLSDDERAGPKYVNTSETVLFHKGRLVYALDLALEHVRRGGHLVLVEGYTDVMAAHQAGLRQVAAVLGTSTTEEHAHLVRRSGARRVSLVFDGDEAGRKATMKALHGLLPLEVELDVVRLPGGEDPCDLLVRAGAAPFAAALQRAVEWFDFLLEGLLALDERARWREVDRVLELVARLPRPLQREGRLGQLAEALGVPLESVRAQLESLPERRREELRARRAQEARPEPAPAPAAAALEPEERRAWRAITGAVLREPGLADALAPLPARCADPQLARLLDALGELRARDGAAASVAGLLTALAGDPARELVVPLLEEAMRSEGAREDLAHGLSVLERLEERRRLELARSLVRDGADDALAAELAALHARQRERFTGRSHGGALRPTGDVR